MLEHAQVQTFPFASQVQSRTEQDEILRKALSYRTLLWRIPQSCRQVKDILFWKGFLQKLVWRLGDLEERVQAKQPPARPSFKTVAESPEEKQLVDSALNKHKLSRHPGEVICVRFNAEISRRHLSCLLPDQWVNDEIMNCYLRLLQEQSKGQLWCPSSFFWPKLEAGGHAAVHRWARRAAVDVAGCNAIIVPLHLEGCHWSLGVLEMLQRKILYMDSLGLPAPQQLQPRLIEYVAKEVPSLSGFDWPLSMINKTPTQQNTSDCGIFVLAYAERIAMGLPVRSVDGSPSGINHKRRSIALAIIEGKLPSSEEKSLSLALLKLQSFAL
ncbi:unnamed protein product [Durusdinium trenchii]|uniref:Ubiquitin-like protease family profile domain-containing protein n=3 Tax=Durusdinium trenchii TaxID=1381693 RepID=A0ABP0LCN3_9DINO